jgi:hypothetical protein
LLPPLKQTQNKKITQSRLQLKGRTMSRSYHMRMFSAKGLYLPAMIFLGFLVLAVFFMMFTLL